MALVLQRNFRLEMFPACLLIIPLLMELVAPLGRVLLQLLRLAQGELFKGLELIATLEHVHLSLGRVAHPLQECAHMFRKPIIVTEYTKAQAAIVDCVLEPVATVVLVS